MYFDVQIPPVDWIGLRKIIGWLLELPPALGVFVVGLFVAIPFVLLDSVIESFKERRAEKAAERDEISN